MKVPDVSHYSVSPLYTVPSHHILATRMTSLYSQIGEFDESVEEWPLYMERLSHHLAANEGQGSREATFRLPGRYQSA